jgi:hypothetical protein
MAADGTFYLFARVDEFYKKGSQEKTPPRPGGDFFLAPDLALISQQ